MYYGIEQKALASNATTGASELLMDRLGGRGALRCACSMMKCRYAFFSDIADFIVTQKSV